MLQIRPSTCTRFDHCLFLRPKQKRLPLTSCHYPKTSAPQRYSPPLTVRHKPEYRTHTLSMTFDLPDRCLQTSKPTSIALGLPIYVEHGELRPNAIFSHANLFFSSTQACLSGTRPSNPGQVSIRAHRPRTPSRHTSPRSMTRGPRCGTPPARART